MTKFGEMTFCDLKFGKMTFGEMTTGGEMTFGDLTFGEPTGHLIVSFISIELYYGNMNHSNENKISSVLNLNAIICNERHEKGIHYHKIFTNIRIANW